MRILYLFAGPSRLADIGAELRQLADDWNKTQAGRDEGRHGDGCIVPSRDRPHIDLHCTEVDILRSADDDLLQTNLQNKILADIHGGSYEVVLAAPPCNTYSRATFSKEPGPMPCRDKAWPKGFPWNEAHARQRAEEGTQLADFALKCISEAETVGCTVWMEFPEDLGSAARGDPASLWQLPECQTLKSARGSIFQCEWADVNYSKPTGILTNSKFFYEDPRFHVGWPTFRSGSAGTRIYTGPLPNMCTHGGHAPLIGRDTTNAFHTTATAAYPEGLCRAIASAIFHSEVFVDTPMMTWTPTLETGRAAEPTVMSPPSRTQVSTSTSEDPSQVYVGRGSKTFNVTDGGWGNPFPIGRDGNRMEVIEKHRRWLAEQEGEALTLALRALQGKKLACHCHPSSPCHADNIIETYDRLFGHPATATVNTAMAAKSPPVTEPIPPPPTAMVNTAMAAESPPVTEAIPPPPTDGALTQAAQLRGWISTDHLQREAAQSPHSEDTAGYGSPLWIGRGRKLRRLSDGGGLCSPGCWPPNQRKDRGTLSQWLRVRTRRCISDWCSSQDTKPSSLLSALIGGSWDTVGIPDSETEAIRTDLRAQISAEVMASFEVGVREDQPIDVELLGAFLKGCGDPDWRLSLDLRQGVRIGVGTDLPRTPDVFEEKTAWRLPEQRPGSGWDFSEDTFEGMRCDNYASAKQFRAEVLTTLEDQTARGQIAKMTEAEAITRYGDRLTIASLGAIEKSRKDDGTAEIRIIHDGTHKVDVNKYIRVRDKIPFPLAPDVARVIRHQAASNMPFYALTADVKEAHRAIAVDPRDWPLQACQVQPGGDVYCNKRGTYGVASAAYWWGRLGAALHRAILYTWSNQVHGWALLFADDWLWTSTGKDFCENLISAILLLRIFRVPLSWRKIRGGQVVPWIGYEINLKESTLGISENRALWLTSWLERRLLENRVLLRELREALGRMIFIYGALIWDKPFLAPLFIFLSHGPPGSCLELPLFVRTVMQWLLQRIRVRRSYPCGNIRHKKGSVLRVDAKAEGQAIGIGGWMPHVDATGKIVKANSRWFSFELTEAQAPWAYCKGEPYKTISSLELLATTVGMTIFEKDILGEMDGDGIVQVTGHTDSQVSANVLSRGMSTSFPLCCVVMELAARLEKSRAILDLEWAPRELNQEADDLSNSITEGFDPALRTEVVLGDMSWLVLPQLFREGLEFYSETLELKASQAPGPLDPRERPPPRKQSRKGERLKDREPW
jgi:hypothetical protein